MAVRLDRRWMERTVDGLAGATVSEGAFAPGPAIWVGRREIAHADADDRLDVRLTRAEISRRRAELRDDPAVVLRRGTSDWIEVVVSSGATEHRARELILDAVTANAVTAPPGEPPSGSDLERRRRFH